MADKYRKKVYCSVQFLKEYIATLEDKSYSFSDYQTMKLWTCLQSLLFSCNIDLYCDMSSDDIVRVADEIYKRRLRDTRNGRETILTFWEKIVSNIDLLQRENKLHIHYVGKNMQEFINETIENNSWDIVGLYILCDVIPSIIEEAKANGVLLFAPENIGDFTPLLNDTGQAIKYHESGTWYNILKGRMLPCNSMIMVDNYALDDTRLFDTNIRPIFDCILPERLTGDTDFQITFVQANKNKDIENRKRMIDETLATIRPNLKFDVSIIQCMNEFHDRTIITNNMWISSGGGFDLYKANNTASKATLISIVNPFLNDTICWGETAYINLMNDIRRVFGQKQNKNKNLPYYYVGSGKNRLIE